MSDKVMTGGCICGAVQYTIQGAPKSAFWGQRRACRKMTGSDHATALAVDADNLTVTGALIHYDRTAASGLTVRTCRCATWHAAIHDDPRRALAVMMVYPGSPDDPSAVVPNQVFHASERIPWDVTDLPATD